MWILAQLDSFKEILEMHMLCECKACTHIRLAMSTAAWFLLSRTVTYRGGDAQTVLRDVVSYLISYWKHVKFPLASFGQILCLNGHFLMGPLSCWLHSLFHLVMRSDGARCWNLFVIMFLCLQPIKTLITFMLKVQVCFHFQYVSVPEVWARSNPEV